MGLVLVSVVHRVALSVLYSKSVFAVKGLLIEGIKGSSSDEPSKKKRSHLFTIVTE